MYSTSNIFSFHLVGPPALLQAPIVKTLGVPYAPAPKAKMLDVLYGPILRQARSDVPRHILKAKYLRSAEQLSQTNLGRTHVAQLVVALVTDELGPCPSVPPPRSIFAIVIRHLSATPARRPPGRVHGLVDAIQKSGCAPRTNLEPKLKTDFQTKGAKPLAFKQEFCFVEN